MEPFENDTVLKDQSVNRSNEENLEKEQSVNKPNEESLEKEQIKTKSSLTKKCLAYMRKILNNLRKDNRSLVTGLIVVSAISCFFTVSLTYFIQQNNPKEAIYFYEGDPTSFEDYYFDYSFEPEEAYSYPFNSNDASLFFNEIQNFFDGLFDHSSNPFSNPASDYLFPKQGLQEF
ncbi:MAG: hypothetical protein K2G70_06960 [Turicibacter sp.]|nr:hypothetical protein [Turicibacter sp.]